MASSIRLRRVRSSTFEAGLGLVLLLAITVMIGCKSGGEGGSAGSGASGGSGGSNAGGDFEGVVNMNMTNTGTPEGKVIQTTYYMKSDRVRTETKVGDTPEMQGIMLMDLPAGKMTTLMPKQKMYMTMDLKQMRDVAGQTEDRKFPKITDTGKKETVAGYTCEHYLIGDEQDMDMCVAKGLGYFGMGGGTGKNSALSDLFSPKMKAEAAASPEWAKLLEGGAFPLKMTMTKGGQTTMTAEVTSVERKKLDDSLFVVPADYKEMKMPAGMPMPSVPGKTGQ